MQIACPNCNTTYQVADASLGQAGRSVRCVRCRNVWFATNPSTLAAIARDHRSDVAAFTARTTIADLIADPLPPEDEPVGEWSTPVEDPDPAYVEQGQETAAQALLPAEEPVLAGEPSLEMPDEPALEPVEIADAPMLSPADDGSTALATDPPPGEDIETTAARRIPRRSKRKPQRRGMPGVSTAILMLVAVNTALLGWRADVVRWLPQTAALYAAIGFPVNLRGLAFSDVTTEKETHDGVQVLVVEGTITSVARRAVEVPRLRFAVRNASGSEIYTWTALPTRSVLAPGETLAFHSRLASPPRDAQEVLVRFFNRRDLVAGIQ